MRCCFPSIGCTFHTIAYLYMAVELQTVAERTFVSVFEWASEDFILSQQCRGDTTF